MRLLGAQHFSALSRMLAKSFFENFGPECEVFELSYPRLSHMYHKGCLNPEYGSAEDKLQKWNWVQQCPLLHRRGVNAKEGRWYEIPARALANIPLWYGVDLVGKYICTINNWEVKYSDLDVIDEAENSDGAMVDGGDCAVFLPCWMQVVHPLTLPLFRLLIQPSQCRLQTIASLLKMRQGVPPLKMTMWIPTVRRARVQKLLVHQLQKPLWRPQFLRVSSHPLDGKKKCGSPTTGMPCK